MGDRWVLNRAGIVNVYQYGDETLHFAGGRLLLRGVNGSGKSTAMNMLLPFLLDGDTRRIDAAGEQSGVLRSWMLSGRDEHQPVGYLWVELRRGDDGGEHRGAGGDDGGDGDDEGGDDGGDARPRHVTCGCGIRANRSTDRVTTWWFVTHRRPGIDLALVENRTPLSADALRATLGAGAVFAHDQRAAYRDEVRARFYGGADLDQHIRLLHVVRNPRVGDRIDLDLPSYLEDALPQLSEAALDDAAQPLEDLEEHRRNVEDLTRTVTTLDALDAVYRGYARAELHRRAHEALALVDEHRRRRADEAAARRRLAEAEAERTEAEQASEQLDAEQRRLRTEIQALTARPEYQAGAELTHLRDHVASLDEQHATALRRAETAAGRRASARAELDRAGADAEHDASALRDVLADLTRLAVDAGLTARVPDAPGLDIRPGRSDDVPVPTSPLDAEPLRRRLADVRASARTRSGDIAEVRRTLDAVDTALAALDAAERALADATAAEADAATAFTQARAHADGAVQAWRADLEAWLARLDEHRLAEGLPAVDPAPLATSDLAGDRDEVAAALQDAAQQTVDHHRQIDATLRARRSSEQAIVDDLAAQLDELQRRTLPDPPAGNWQRHDRGACLADLIDFRPDLDEPTRAGLEAAMEAAGLLGAELGDDGTLALADGQLVALPGKPADQPLSALLAVTVPDDLTAAVDAHRVERVLDAISTSPDDLATDGDRTVVTVDGRFRAGVLHGRHAKQRAEHIGVAARRAALERRRTEVAARLDDARAVVAGTDAEIAHRTDLSVDATRLRQALPQVAPVTDALVRAEHAERHLDDARTRLGTCRDAQRQADAAHAEAVDASRRIASTLALPPDRTQLDAVERAVGEAVARCDAVDSTTAALVRSVGHWIERGTAFEQAVDDEEASRAAHREATARRDEVATKLATLEDTVGLEYDEIVATLTVSQRDLDTTTADLDQARRAHTDAHGRVTALTRDAENAAGDRRAAETRCVAALVPLRRTLAVPGLVASGVTDTSTGPTGPTAPTAPAGEATAVAAPDRATAPPADDAAQVRREPGGADLADESGGVATSGAGDADRGASTVHDDAEPRAAFPAVAETPDGVRELATAITARIPAPDGSQTTADGVRQSLRQRRDALGAGWDAEDRQPDESLPLHIEVTGPLGRMPLPDALERVDIQLRNMSSLLSAKQDQALRNLLQGLIAREVAHKLHAARELVDRMNARLDTITTSQGIGVSLRWTRRDDLDPALADTIGLLAKPPDLRTADEDHQLTRALAARIADARREDPEAPYRELIARVLDYRAWHRMALYLRRPGRSDERITRRTALSEGEKKMVSYLPLFAAVAASCDALAESEPAAPRFVLLDDAFAKVSEDNHAKLFGLLVELDLDFIATSERLWGTHDTVPQLAITEVLRDPDLRVIVLEHSRWDGRQRTAAA